MLSGTISQKIRELVHLQELILYFNEIGGSIPTVNADWEACNVRDPLRPFAIIILFVAFAFFAQDIGLLKELTVLSLSSNNLTGSIPSQISGLSKLTRLLLDRNLLVGPVPPITPLVTGMW